MDEDRAVRRTVSLPATLWREVAEFHERERCATEAEAVRRLILVGLRAEATVKKGDLVRVTIEERHAGLFFATSPDLKDLFVAKESIEAAMAAVPDSISALFEASGGTVIVEPVINEAPHDD